MKTSTSHRQATGFVLALAGVLTALLVSSQLAVFTDSEGFLDTRYAILPPLSAAFLLAIAGWSTRFRIATLWFALFLVGQGVVLQLVDAGTRIHYQHSRLIDGIDTLYEGTLLALLLLQAIILVAGISRRSTGVAEWLSSRPGKRRAIIIGMLLVLLATFPSRELHLYAAELLVNAAILCVQAGCLLLGLISLPQKTTECLQVRFNSFLDQPPPGSRTPDYLVTGCIAWTVCIAALLSIYSYERHPHIADEVAYIYQANYFAEGRLGTPAPPVPEAVESYLIDCTAGPCVSPVPPGWPAMLALGSAVGTDWLVNPLLAGLNVLLLYLLLRQLYDRHAARLGVLLVATAPWYLLMAMNFMTHTFSLSCALVAALSVVRMRCDGNSLWAVPGGIAIGVLSLTRPLEGLMAATVFGLAALFIRGRRMRLAPVAMLALVSMAVGAIALPYNQALTGDPETFPIMAYADKVLGPGINSLGFGPDKGIHWGGLDPFPGHGLRDVLVNAVLNLVAVNIELFGWSVGSLLPVMLMLAMRPLRMTAPADRWMLFSIAVVFAYQSLYWFSGGPDFGARYYYLIVIPLLALTVQALRTVDGASTSRVSGRVAAGVLVLAIGTMTAFLPWRAIDKYHHYRDMRPDIRQLIDTHDMGRDLLLISGKDHPDLNSAIVYTATDPYGDDPVIALDKDMDTRRKLLAAYRDRNVWLIDGPSLTGAGYRVTAGPLKATDLEH